ncbi:MAG TPA: serine/threonine-protein kinase [Kofleriaceae bacterium]|nr:serine/threonine-protein kinase [Kofleriaceae bacterium]
MATERSPLVVVGAVAFAAGGVIAAWSMRAAKPSTPPLAAVTGALETGVRATRDAVGERAAAVTALPVLAHAVATDEGTVRDLAGKEITLRPRAGEHLEIAQIDRASLRVATLLRVPADAPTSPHLASPGLHATITGGTLLVTDVRDVMPSDPVRAAEVRGALAVTAAVDLAPVHVALGGGSARLELAGAILTLGPVGVTDDTTRSAAIEGIPGLTVHVAAAPAGGMNTAGLALGALVAAAGLAAIAAGLRRRIETRALAADAPVVTDASPPGSPAARPRSPTGERYGRYQRVRLLGSGGMADVYLARATGEAGFERPVALKVLHPHMARRPEAVNHFLDEARLASRLDHPSIVAVHDLGRAGSEYFIAMEYIDGADLDRVLRSMRDRGAHVPLAVALTILRRVCDGLHAAHTACGEDGVPINLIHRDVKTGNVLLSRQGAVKIGDFGIARAATTVRTTTIGETKGTAEVMAPEQRMGHEIDVRADVFSVAALGYELLTGAAVNLDLAILAQLGLEGWPHLPMPTTIRPDLPVELDAILIGALAYQAAGRPDSCAALEEQLAAVANRHGLACGDKEIAAWLAGELPRLLDRALFTAAGTPPTQQAAIA